MRNGQLCIYMAALTSLARILKRSAVKMDNGAAPWALMYSATGYAGWNKKAGSWKVVLKLLRRLWKVAKRHSLAYSHVAKLEAGRFGRHFPIDLCQNYIIGYIWDPRRDLLYKLLHVLWHRKNKHPKIRHLYVFTHVPENYVVKQRTTGVEVEGQVGEFRFYGMVNSYECRVPNLRIVMFLLKRPIAYN